MKSITASWKECIVRYEKMQENGLMKKVNETYVVDGVLFGEAEERICDYIQNYVDGEYDVLNINPAAYKEVFFSDDTDADKSFKARLQFITIDEKTEKEKKTNVYYLVQAGSFDGAKKNVDAVMGTTMIDYVIVKIEETKILDVVQPK